MSADRRRAERHELDLPVSCRIPATACKAVMHNLSTSGCMLQTVKQLLPGSTVLLSINGGRESVGTVVWTVGRTAGVHFLVPLAEETVEAIARPGGQDIEVQAA